jgi:hypothetical protein
LNVVGTIGHRFLELLNGRLRFGADLANGLCCSDPNTYLFLLVLDGRS